MRLFTVLMLGLLAASGCRKKSAPEFYALESDYTILVDREGDDAYLDDGMATVLAGLKAIPTDAEEGPRAATLIATIEREQKRVEDEAEARDAALAAAARPAPMPPGSDFGAPTGPSAGSADDETAEAGPAADAGPARPVAGMSQADFQRLFGACFTPGPPKALPGQAEGATMQLRDDDACRKQYGVPDADTKLYFVFVDDGLAGQRSERQTRTETVAPKPPEPPKPVDAGVYLLVPGAPLPDALRPLAPPAEEP